ncbi:MAG: GldG family protein [Cellulosilyticaceae bacterium]
MKKITPKKIDWKDKKIRYGSYSAAMTAVVMAILIVLNMMAAALDVNIDLTEEKFFSISEKTVGTLATLQDSVDIYVIEETGMENTNFRDILKQYEKTTEQVNVVYKDPVLYPQFAQQYMEVGEGAQIANGSIIVENTVTGKYKLILARELLNISFDPYYGPQVESIALEERVTNAIEYVTSDVEKTVYYTQNHMEYDVPKGLIAELEKKNYTVQPVQLMTEDLGNPAESIVMIYSPHIDFSEEEKDKVIAFLEAGGKAMIFTDPDTPELPNFEEILAYYGLETQTGVVVEGSNNHMVSPYPTVVLPNIATHTITTALIQNKLPIAMPLASSIKEATNKRSSLVMHPLLTTSEDSWLKDITSTNGIEKEGTDISGPLSLAYSVAETHTNGNNEQVETRIIAIANTGLLDTTQINTAATGNMGFVMNSIDWLSGEEENLTIPPKAPTNYVLSTMTGSQVLIFAGTALIGLPLIAGVLGLVTWLRRRNL